MNGQDWLLSGIPRSGTSLCCRLLGELPDTLALSEPLRLTEFDALPDSASAVDYVVQRMGEIRMQALAEARAPSVHVAGRLHDGRVAEDAGQEGLRSPQGEQGEIAIDKALSANFLLVVKHNALFAALLPRLAQQFSCLALVRNPLAVLASWQTVDLPVHVGQIPAGERYDSALRLELAAEPDALARQVHILNWFFDKYRRNLQDKHILRYEALVGSAGETLFAAVGRSGAAPTDIASRNQSTRYASVNTGRLAEALLVNDGSWRGFYSPEEVETLAAEIESGA